MSVLALSLAGLLVGPPVADSDYETGEKAYAQGRYAEAAAAFERAYERQRKPLFLFVWAQAERKAGRCEVALPLYREFLTLDPSEADIEVARGAIEACGEDPDLVPEPPPAPEVEDKGEDQGEGEGEGDSEGEGEGEGSGEGAGGGEGEQGSIVDQPPERTPRPVARDPWGHALTWSGVVVAGIGAGLLGTAHGRRVAGARAPDEQAYRDALEGAPGLSRAGIGLLAAGGALLVAGIVRFSSVAVSRRRARATVQRMPGLVWKFELAPRRSPTLR
ncbi:MAG: hypothetical protein AAGF11_35605 [Myxococcota bacterium]